VTAPFPESLCHRCANHRIVRTARSAFLMCQHPELPKYPRQPVTTCPGFTEAQA
jgi:hypothetical protein